MKHSMLRNALTSAVAAATLSSPALAQNVLEEVVVVAQKREQNLQEVPIAINAFTGRQMNALGVSESFDIAAFSPGVHISGNLAGQNTQFSIRGVTQNDFNDIIEAPNAVYLDEGYIAVAQAQTFAVFDVDRVEILKGPRARCSEETPRAVWCTSFPMRPPSTGWKAMSMSSLDNLMCRMTQIGQS